MLVLWRRPADEAAARATAVLARLAAHQQAEAQAARALPALLAERITAGEASRVAEALRRWAGGEPALGLLDWLMAPPC